MTLNVKLILDEFNRRFDEWETRWDRRFSSAAYIDQPPTPPSVNHPSSDASARAPSTRAAAVGAVVIADNWGGCFDDGERYCTAPSVIADDWGGLFDGEVANVNTEFADHWYGPSSTDPDAPHDADADSFFINTGEGPVEPVFGDTAVGALGDVGAVPDLVEEEEVPVDTPAKCLMRVLNRSDYYVSNRGDYYGPYTSSTVDAAAVLLADAAEARLDWRFAKLPQPQAEEVDEPFRDVANPPSHPSIVYESYRDAAEARLDWRFAKLLQPQAEEVDEPFRDVANPPSHPSIVYESYRDEAMAGAGARALAGRCNERPARGRNSSSDDRSEQSYLTPTCEATNRAPAPDNRLMASVDHRRRQTLDEEGGVEQESGGAIADKVEAVATHELPRDETGAEVATQQPWRLCRSTSSLVMMGSDGACMGFAATHRGELVAGGHAGGALCSGVVAVSVGHVRVHVRPCVRSADGAAHPRHPRVVGGRRHPFPLHLLLRGAVLAGRAPGDLRARRAAPTTSSIEEDVPFDTLTKCSMRVLNRGTNYGHNTAASLKTSGKRAEFIVSIVKGRGGSLFREKMIVGVGAHFIVIVDASKLVSRLGCMGANPIEVIPFDALHALGLICGLFDGLPGSHTRRRSVPAAAANGKEDSKQYIITDNDNYIVEDGIRGDLRGISDRLLQITGVIEHDMFLGYFSHAEEGGDARTKVQLTEAAERCFDELVGRGLLRLTVGSNGAAGARMPIMICSFAKDVYDHENFCTESAANNLSEVRRLSIVENEADDRIGEGMTMAAWTTSMETVVKLEQAGERLWVKMGGHKVLNVDKYDNIFAKPGGSFRGPDVHVETARRNTVTYSILEQRDAQKVQLFKSINSGAVFGFPENLEEAARASLMSGIKQPWPPPMELSDWICAGPPAT
jgi:hypothetical protein